MSDRRGGPGSWLDRLLGAAVGLLLAALAVHWAVGLLLEVWQPLAVIAAVVVAGIVLHGVWRSRRGGW